MKAAILFLALWFAGCAGKAFTTGGGGAGGASGTGNVGFGGAGHAGSAGTSSACPGDCPTLGCGEGSHEQRVPGQCCPVCVSDRSPHPSCSDVFCLEPPEECPPGYDIGREPGACCMGCVRNGQPTGGIDCSLVECQPLDTCPDGYIPADYAGTCCTTCIPDPGYCEDASDCTLATDATRCCSCPAAISVRAAEENACYREASDTEPTPLTCGGVCEGVACFPCEAPEGVTCSSRQCRLQ